MTDPVLNAAIGVFVFLFGTILGSGITAFVWRLKRGVSWRKGFSLCPLCRHRLGFWDLIPIAGFLVLRGTCRYCRKRISVSYPLTEIGVGLAAAGAWFRFGWSVPFGVTLVILVFLATLFLFDARYKILPDAVTLPGLGAAFVGGLLLGHALPEVLLGGIIGMSFFLIQYLVSRGNWIGGGDIRLGALIGLLVGWQELLLVLFLSYTTGALIGLILLATKRLKLTSHVPFGTFLAAATFVSLLFGKAIIAWYFHGLPF